VKAAVLTVGDELISGYRLDTNSQAVSRRLAAVPLDVVLHLTVGDDEAAIARALEVALAEADVVIVTGGLGPTEDDLTRQAVAGYFGVDLVEDAEALARIRERFTRRGHPMPPRNRVQALVPRGSQVIHNDRGTAAGFYLQHGGKHLFVIPGIPYEMEGMLDSFVLPRLRRLVSGTQHMRQAVLKVYGLPESEVNRRLGSMMARGRNPVLGLLPHLGTITVEVTARGASPGEAEALLAADIESLRERLGRHVISEDGRDLPQVVAEMLEERGWTVAVAELGTGGLVAARLSSPAAPHRWFRRGIVFGSAEDALGGLQEKPVDADLALVMASAVRNASGADVGVGVGRLEVPEDAPPHRPYGLVHVAVDVRGREAYRVLRFSGDRARVREWAADGVLALLREALLDLPRDVEDVET